MFKLHTSRLKKAGWSLSLTVEQARRNGELVALSDSTLLRFIDELNGTQNRSGRVAALREKLARLRQAPSSPATRRALCEAYCMLDGLQFQPDYLCLVMDSVTDYRRANRGFTINGISFTRLLGTNGGVKASTIVYVNQSLYPALMERIDNGRDISVPLVPAKLEAYRALVCSGSTPVSSPKGVLVVNDCITSFRSDILRIDDQGAGEPVCLLEKDASVTLVDSDGYGLISPDLSRRWNEELGGKGVLSGYCIRNAWCKGMLFCFDFHAFARKIAGSRMVQDAWGHWRDINEAEVILTTSMLKLWYCYPSCEAYLENCRNYHYTFSVTKKCPQELESERNLNYQFLQSYHLSDAQLEALIRPTIEEISDVLGGDWRKSVLFLKGMQLNEANALCGGPAFANALMADERLIHDPFVQERIHGMLQKRLDEAKLGAIRVHGNFSIVSGDPYALCQSLFQLPVTGLLRAGESYNRYWNDQQVERVACFRAPMTCHNNIRILRMRDTPQLREWYRYLTTVTVFNAWDTAAHALNGLDKDSDSCLLTDNPILVENTREEPAILCVQRQAEKKAVTQEDLIQSNINSFGDEIGAITNRITSMFEAQARFAPGSEEYQTLDYRIKCGQLFQQNAIDKAKGILAKPMPKAWYSPAALRIQETDSPGQANAKRAQQRLLADKKPYFMAYLYPQEGKRYRLYTANANAKCLMEFGLSMQELMQKARHTPEEDAFLQAYEQYMPLGTAPCLLNRLCWRMEESFDGLLKRRRTKNCFDPALLKSGVFCSENRRRAVAALHENYMREVQQFKARCARAYLREEETAAAREALLDQFRRDCAAACPNEQELCDILIDLCYGDHRSKQFVWDLCGHVIIRNLLQKNGGVIHYPVADETGTILYRGQRFSLREQRLPNT
ncbi:MAG TPA: hypothetical protein IAD07_11160 [Candidatus Fimivicinus intestinavium]|nr:hypothetical protein [Candidatus Fimivicinus intestinavium]